jgi:hypothetical protein
MAMRLYSRDEFEADIKARWKLEKTDHATASHGFWKTPSGRFITVPVLEQYPDYMLDTVHEQLTAIDSDTSWWATNHN